MVRYFLKKVDLTPRKTVKHKTDLHNPISDITLIGEEVYTIKITNERVLYEFCINGLIRPAS